MASGIQRGDCLLRPLKWYRTLQTGKVRRQEGYFLLEGVKAVSLVVAAHPEMVEELLIAEQNVLPSFAGAFPVRSLTESQYTTISPSVSPQGVAALIKIPGETYSDHLPSDPGRLVVMLDNVQDPGNAGTIIRTAAAFGFSGVLMTTECADPFSPKSVQASAGTVLNLWVRRHEKALQCLDAMKMRGYQFWCAALGGETSIMFPKDAPLVIALGNEGAGLSADVLARADKRFAIPMAADAAESLNVAIAGAVAFFCAFRGSGW